MTSGQGRGSGGDSGSAKYQTYGPQMKTAGLPELLQTIYQNLAQRNDGQVKENY